MHGCRSYLILFQRRTQKKLKMLYKARFIAVGVAHLNSGHEQRWANITANFLTFLLLEATDDAKCIASSRQNTEISTKIFYCHLYYFAGQGTSNQIMGLSRPMRDG